MVSWLKKLFPDPPPSVIFKDAYVVNNNKVVKTILKQIRTCEECPESRVTPGLSYCDCAEDPRRRRVHADPTGNRSASDLPDPSRGLGYADN
jgi:hypothetical protein